MNFARSDEKGPDPRFAAAAARDDRVSTIGNIQNGVYEKKYEVMNITQVHSMSVILVSSQVIYFFHKHHMKDVFIHHFVPNV